MHNFVKKATRITPKTKFLIDLIVTTKPELVRKTGVLLLGISDHSMISSVFTFFDEIHC